MNKKQIATLVLVMALAAGIGWSMGLLDGTDPQVAELERLRDESFKNRDQLSDEQRRAQFGGFREKMRGLSEDQRRQFYENSRPMFQQMMVERMDRFFALPPDEQATELDRLIDRMEEPRDRDGDRGDRSDRGDRGSRSPQQRDQRRKERLDRTTPEMRGKMDRFRDILNERREQRGLDPIDRWGRFGRGR